MLTRRFFLQSAFRLFSASALLQGTAIPAFAAAGQTARRAAAVSFSWYENVQPADLAKTAVDALTGASLLAQGLTTLAARWIAEAHGIEHVILRTAKAYPANYEACLELAVEEKAERIYPALSAETLAGLERIRSAELIFLAFPNWSYTIPRAVAAYARSAGLSGKVIAPICVHGTGGLARTMTDLRREAPGAVLLAPLSLEREEVPASREAVLAWAERALG